MLYYYLVIILNYIITILLDPYQQYSLIFTYVYATFEKNVISNIVFRVIVLIF